MVYKRSRCRPVRLGCCSAGFVVSGADSRTAVADSAGGKTQMASLLAALVMAAVLLFLTGPLAYVPTAALAAILISSALGLFDWASLRRYYRLSQPEFRQSIVAMLGVMTLGVLQGVLIAVGLAMLKLLRQASHPHDAVLGVVEGDDTYTAAEESGGKKIGKQNLFYTVHAGAESFRRNGNNGDAPVMPTIEH